MVNFGVFMFCTANSMQPAELAIAAEDLGFESLYFPEHTHIPMRRWNGEPPDRYGTVTLNREGIRPYGRPSDLDTFTFAEEYISLYDPFIAIATAAASVNDRYGSRLSCWCVGSMKKWSERNTVGNSSRSAVARMRRQFSQFRPCWPSTINPTSMLRLPRARAVSCVLALRFRPGRTRS